jgi:dihydrolipoamide dehydrogenase
MSRYQSDFDLIVIGSGSGLDVANAAAEKGLRVALIEKKRMGGTCLNNGCIPSKLLIHSADLMESIRQSEKFGIVIDGKISIDFEKIVNRVTGIVDSESEEIQKAYSKVDNPRMFHSECRFVGTKELELKALDKDLQDERIKKSNKLRRGNRDRNNNRISALRILIASGSRPRIPKINGLDKAGFITSDQALRLKRQPAALTIIGGGYICCELAHFFGSLGTKINIIQLRDKLLPDEDEDISQRLTDVFVKKYDVHLGYVAESVSKDKNNDGHVLNNSTSNAGIATTEIYTVTAKNKESNKTITIESDELLIAVGRIPNSDILDLDKTGVKLDDMGYIVTDEYLQTNIEGIYSLGDVVGRYPFKHSANLEARYAIHNIIQPQDMIPVDYAAVPHAIFTSPQIAAVGATEQFLKQKGKEENKDYLKSIYPFINTGMGLAIEDREGFIKFLVDKDSRKILGCHIIGTDAPVLIHEVVVAMKTFDSKGNIGTIDNITRAVHVHPALSEVVVRAASQI